MLFRILDTGELHVDQMKLPYIIMECMAGALELGEYAKKNFRSLTPADVLRLFNDIIGGLACLHAASCYHMDVKPENILVGSDGRAKIADLGYSVSIRNSASARPIGVRFTLARAAPELREIYDQQQRGPTRTTGSGLSRACQPTDFVRNSTFIRLQVHSDAC